MGGILVHAAKNVSSCFSAWVFSYRSAHMVIETYPWGELDHTTNGNFALHYSHENSSLFYLLFRTIGYSQTPLVAEICHFILIYCIQSKYYIIIQFIFCAVVIFFWHLYEIFVIVIEV